jgi:hypothetical protein
MRTKMTAMRRSRGSDEDEARDADERREECEEGEVQEVQKECDDNRRRGIVSVVSFNSMTTSIGYRNSTSWACPGDKRALLTEPK